MKFSEMPYTRPDPEAVKAGLQQLTERLRNADSYEAARAVFLEKEEKEKTVDTMGTLAYIRHSIDTRDEFYDGEIEFWDEIGPEIEEYEQEWLSALLESPYRGDFEREYGDLLFVNAEIDRKTCPSWNPSRPIRMTRAAWPHGKPRAGGSRITRTAWIPCMMSW